MTKTMKVKNKVVWTTSELRFYSQSDSEHIGEIENLIGESEWYQTLEQDAPN